MASETGCVEGEQFTGLARDPFLLGVLPLDIWCALFPHCWKILQLVVWSGSTDSAALLGALNIMSRPPPSRVNLSLLLFPLEPMAANTSQKSVYKCHGSSVQETRYSSKGRVLDSSQVSGEEGE